MLTNAVAMVALGVVMQALPVPVSLELPAGATLALVNTRPVWAKTAKAGDPLYLETVAPTVAGGRAVIPAGTYVLAAIDDVLKPTRKVNQALLTVRLEEMVLPGGTTLAFPEKSLARVSVQVTLTNDLLLDNGTQMQIQTIASLPLPAATIGQAFALAVPPVVSSFQTATTCRFIPGTPGSPGTPATPDTVIPGNPGTPDTVIPGADGMPSTVIPGIPATQPTVIPGSPGTPDTPGTDPIYCPDPPLVLGSVAETTASPLAFDPPAAAPSKKKKQKKS